MTLVDLSRARGFDELCRYYGFIIREEKYRPGFFRLGLDTKHALWSEWGLTDDNTVSSAMDTVEQAHVFIEGWMGCRQFQQIARGAREEVKID